MIGETSKVNRLLKRLTCFVALIAALQRIGKYASARRFLARLASEATV